MGILCIPRRMRLLPSGCSWGILDDSPSPLQPEVAGGARGVINGIGNLGGFAGPYLVGLLIQMYNYDVGIYGLVVLLVVGAALTISLPSSIDEEVKTEQTAPATH